MPDLTVFPTDAADGSVATEARWRKMARLWVPSGVVAGLAPALIAGPAVTVQPGSAWLDGHFAELTSVQTVPVTANGLLVVRFTPADNRAELLYRDGATVPTQTDPTWELPIAQMIGGAMVVRSWPTGAWENGFYSVASNAGAVITATGAGPPFSALPNSTLVLGAGQYFLLGTFDMNVITASGGNILSGVIYMPTAVAGSVVQSYRALMDMNTVKRETLTVQGFATIASPTPVQLGGIKNTGAGVANMETPSVLTAIRYA